MTEIFSQPTFHKNLVILAFIGAELAGGPILPPLRIPPRNSGPHSRAWVKIYWVHFFQTPGTCLSRLCEAARLGSGGGDGVVGVGLNASLGKANPGWGRRGPNQKYISR